MIADGVRGGADGVVPAREHVEMWQANLSAAGESVGGGGDAAGDLRGKRVMWLKPRSISEWLELNDSGSDLRTKGARFQ
jgi:hypothetical protein